MFSRRHTGKSILACTLLGLGINVIFKFITPYTIDLSLNRAEEMPAGALIPFILLAGYELWAYSKGHISQEYLAFAERRIVETTEAENEVSGRQNQYGIKVLALMLGLIGLLIIGLGAVAAEARILVITMGLFLVGLSLRMHPQFSLSKLTRHDKK